MTYNCEGTIGNGQVPGRVRWAIADGSGSLTERVRFDSSGRVLIGDTGNANNDGGLTVNHLTNTDHILTLKSGGVVDHGITSATLKQDVEIDDFATFSKADAAKGGLSINVLAESDVGIPYITEVYGGAPSTDDDDGSLGAMSFYAARHDGSNGILDMAANSNLISWGEMPAAGGRATRMLLKADDGELHLENSTLVGLDDEDDAQIVRAMQKTSADGGIIESQWDNPLYSYGWLKEHGLAGEKGVDGFFLFPLQSRLHAYAGAIWQNFEDLMGIAKVLSPEQRGKLTPRMQNRLQALEGRN